MTARLFPREKSYFRSSDWGIGLAMTLSVLLTVSALAQQPEALPSGVPTYLDEIHGAQAQDWVERQNRKTVSVLEVDPRYRDFYDQILSAEQNRVRTVLMSPRFWAEISGISGRTGIIRAVSGDARRWRPTARF